MKNQTPESIAASIAWTTSLSSIVECVIRQASSGHEDAKKALLQDLVRDIKVKRFLRQGTSSYEEEIDEKLTSIMHRDENRELFHSMWGELLTQIPPWKTKELFSQAWQLRDASGIEKILLWEVEKEAKQGLYLSSGVVISEISELWWKRSYPENEKDDVIFWNQILETLRKVMFHTEKAFGLEALSNDQCAYARLVRRQVACAAFQLLKMNGVDRANFWVKSIPPLLRPDSDTWLNAAKEETRDQTHTQSEKEAARLLDLSIVVDFAAAQFKELGEPLYETEQSIGRIAKASARASIESFTTRDEVGNRRRLDNLLRIAEWQACKDGGSPKIKPSSWADISIRVLHGWMAKDASGPNEENHLEYVAAECWKGVESKLKHGALNRFRTHVCEKMGEEEKNQWEARLLSFLADQKMGVKKSTRGKAL
jgi:hypothetical protein